MTTNSDVERSLRSVLWNVFQFDNFRDGQLEAAREVLFKRDVFVRLKTSGGKSLCYLLPALVQTGVCVVVSPLISLMDDQVLQSVDSLCKIFVNKTAWRILPKVCKMTEKGLAVTRVSSLRDDKLLEDLCLKKYKLSEYLYRVQSSCHTDTRMVIMVFCSLYVPRGHYLFLLAKGYLCNFEDSHLIFCC